MDFDPYDHVLHEDPYSSRDHEFAARAGAGT